MNDPFLVNQDWAKGMQGPLPVGITGHPSNPISPRIRVNGLPVMVAGDKLLSTVGSTGVASGGVSGIRVNGVPVLTALTAQITGPFTGKYDPNIVKNPSPKRVV